MKKKKIFNCEFTNYECLKEGENKDINLEYYMLLNEDKGLYGIEIQKKEKSNLNSEEVIESNSVLNYTSDADKMTNIINKLGEAKVTPVTLFDVMENFKN